MFDVFNNVGVVTIVSGVAGLLFSFVIYKTVSACDAGTEKMQDIAQEIRLGAMAF